MNKEELIEIKNTYDNAGYFMLYVDEVNFDAKLEKKLLNDGIYAVNDFESKFIKEQYSETEQHIEELKMFLEFLIQFMMVSSSDLLKAYQTQIFLWKNTKDFVILKEKIWSTPTNTVTKLRLLSTQVTVQLWICSTVS